jgi:uncharacterized protein
MSRYFYQEVGNICRMENTHLMRPSLNELTQYSILSGYRGSLAYGMYVPNYDIDTMHIFIAPIDGYFGLKQYGSRGTIEIKEWPLDVVGYELKKFVSLLKLGNPNVIGMLWLESQDYLKRTVVGDRMISNRHLFESEKIYHSFIGYAKAQLYKMTHLVEKFGYDTKNAAHLIRLMRMCIEFLNERKFYVKRISDLDQLLDIKNGKWTITEVENEADLLFYQAEKAFYKSELPKEVDSQKIDELLKGIFEEHFYGPR